MGRPFTPRGPQEPSKRGGIRPGSGRPNEGQSGLKRGGYAVNTLLYPNQKAFIANLAAEKHITLSEAFRWIVADAMERQSKA